MTRKPAVAAGGSSDSGTGAASSMPRPSSTTSMLLPPRPARTLCRTGADKRTKMRRSLSLPGAASSLTVAVGRLAPVLPTWRPGRRRSAFTSASGCRVGSTR